MPYKCETLKLKIPRSKDRRVKLTLEERQEIRELYGYVSQRKLAAAYGVSRRLIIFIGDPEQHKENLKRRAEWGGSSQYYSKEKQKEYMKSHRQYKQQLFLNNELREDKTQ